MNLLRLKSEALARFRQQHPQYWLDMLVEQMMAGRERQVVITGTVLAVLRNPELGLELRVPGLNIVTNDGDQYYAQMACAETPTDDFDGASSGLRLGSDNTSPTKSDTDVTTFLSGTGHALDAGYEETNDPDSDNTGAGVDVVTWRYSYATGEGNANGIQEGAIVDDRTTPTAALTHFLFAASFNKTSSDTLKVFVNHEMSGV
jgi:hypothetical protein